MSNHIKIILFLLTAFMFVGVTSHTFDNNNNNMWSLKHHFNNWMTTYQINYKTIDEKEYRYRIWYDNLKFITKKNSEQNNYQLVINEFGDLKWEEFCNTRLGFVPNKNKLPHLSNNAFSYRPFDLPKYVNWTEKGVVTPVKNQYDCGSCWAFSTTGVVESMHAIKTGILVSLSEENLIDCSFSFGNMGCGGGLPSQAMKYIIANNGIDTEDSYPLESIFMFDCLTPDMCTCKFNENTIGATVNGYKNIISGNETDLQYVIAYTGPVSVGIDATNALQFYSSGVFSDENCTSTDLNHSVLAVGYGVMTNGQEYYIVKNSWGESWGMDGYFLLARNKNNMCGISTEAIYPY